MLGESVNRFCGFRFFLADIESNPGFHTCPRKINPHETFKAHRLTYNPLLTFCIRAVPSMRNNAMKPSNYRPVEHKDCTAHCMGKIKSRTTYKAFHLHFCITLIDAVSKRFCHSAICRERDATRDRIVVVGNACIEATVSYDACRRVRTGPMIDDLRLPLYDVHIPHYLPPGMIVGLKSGRMMMPESTLGDIMSSENAQAGFFVRSAPSGGTTSSVEASSRFHQG